MSGIWSISAIKFETAFDEFVDCKEYDALDEALFQVIRKAFIAGWVAAGGDEDALPPNRNITLLEKEDEKPERTE